jgi:Zn-finger nucleic acid-binding protein
MRSYERNGVHVDQCGDCRGLFLDRGELERLVEAEGSFYGGGSQPPPERRDDDRQHGGHDSYEHHGKPYKKKRKNFLEELFD